MSRIAIRVSRFAALGLAALVLGACGDIVDEPTVGVPSKVLQHRFDDADRWTTEEPHNITVCSGRDEKTGAQTGCITTTWYSTEHHYDPPHWELQLWQCGHKAFKSKKSPDGCGSFWYEVTEQVYNDHPDGSMVTFGARP